MIMKYFPFVVSVFALTILLFVPLSEAWAQVVHDEAPMNHGTMGTEDKAVPDLERAFLSMMIPHHVAAVEMSKFVLPLAQDPQVITWAEDIIVAQEEEIALMESWLEERGGYDEEARHMMEEEMAMMMDLLHGDTDPERSFVEHMIPHHLGAVEMALPVLVHSEDEAMLVLARDIIATQAEEIYRFKLWLLDR